MKKIRLSAILLCGITAIAAAAGCKTTQKASEGTLQILVHSAGYGSSYAVELAKAFEAKTGMKYKVTPTTDSGAIESTLGLGAQKNKLDVYFVLGNNVFNQIARSKSIVKGIEGPVWADLSDVYNSPLTGYGETGTVKQYFDEYALDAATYSDDKQYFVSWSQGVQGLIVNETLWNAQNAKLKAAGQPEMKLPRTTGEMFALFTRIAGFKTADPAYRLAADIYPLVYGGRNDYLEMAFYSFWPQWEGKAAIDNFMKGRNAAGTEYTAEIYNTEGRLKAFETIREILTGAGHTDPNNISDDFTQAQLKFLKSKAFFHYNGDWVETESSKQPGSGVGEVDIAFIKSPLLSGLVSHPSVAAEFAAIGDKEQALRDTIDYIDGVSGAVCPINESGAAYKYLCEARKWNKSECTEYLAVVPAYSANLAKAKDFLKFMLSKDGQEIMMKATRGITAPLKVDAGQFDYYQNDASTLVKSKMDLFQNSAFAGKTFNKHPMQYLGGIKTLLLTNDGNFSFEKKFATEGQTAAAYRQSEYQYYSSGWKNAMSKAGVSN